MDRIAVRGLRAFGHHGVFGHERRDGQEFTVDIVLWADTRPAAESDDIERTVHYGTLSERVVEVIAGEPVDLVETLAERISAACLTEPLVREVEITVHKPHAPIPFPFDDVTVTIHRRRS